MIFMKKIIVLLAISSLVGCATIMSPSTERINVTSTKNKSFEARVDGQQFTVPGSVIVERDGNEKYVITSEAGCAGSTGIDKEVESIFWLNIVVGGLLGSSTDMGSGNMWDYDNDVTINCVGN
tara:strand:- start:402 stop:770 length:369 start_codon:yes stop_codon:yes gene_type:complete